MNEVTVAARSAADGDDLVQAARADPDPQPSWIYESQETYERRPADIRALRPVGVPGPGALGRAVQDSGVVCQEPKRPIDGI